MDALPPEETIRSRVDRSVSRLRLQHEIAVQFATSVLRLHNADALLDEACKAVSAGLQSRFFQALRSRPGKPELVREAGEGGGAGGGGIWARRTYPEPPPPPPVTRSRADSRCYRIIWAPNTVSARPNC